MLSSRQCDRMSPRVTAKSGAASMSFSPGEQWPSAVEWDEKGLSPGGSCPFRHRKTGSTMVTTMGPDANRRSVLLETQVVDLRSAIEAALESRLPAPPLCPPRIAEAMRYGVMGRG